MTLKFQEYGNGPELIILHGLYGCSDNWSGIAKQLKEQYRVLIPDLRNHGDSPHSDSMSYSEMLEDIRAFMDSQGVGTASILGHSMGGKLAMFFARAYPQKLKKLIVADMSPRAHTANMHSSANYKFHSQLIHQLIQLKPENLQNFAEASDRLDKLLGDKRLSAFMLKNLTKEGKHLKWKIHLKAIQENLPRIMQGMHTENFQENKIRIHSLFLGGEKSQYIPLEDYKLIRYIFPYSEIIKIPNAGHWLHAEQAKLFVKNIRYFLAS